MSWITVKDMYDYANTNSLKLLSNYNATFWNEYTTNYVKYDKLFSRMYLSFRYFYQDDSSVVSSLTTDFIDEVYNHLLINTKKYEELYRVHVLADNSYSITNNVDVTDTMDRDKLSAGTFTQGQRTDTYNETQGSRSDTTSDSVGSRTDTSETQVSAFNTSAYSNQNKVTDISGAQSNSSSFSKGSQSNSSTMQKSSQTDTNNVADSDNYTLHRVGKVGDLTMAEMLQKHLDLWTPYQFYVFIFKEICAELLLS